jgi:predicted nucleic acid-binding protein
MWGLSNTSPINYLLRIDGIGILHNLYGRIIVPHAVSVELGNREAPTSSEIGRLDRQIGLSFGFPFWNWNRQLARLGAGEKDAILLAEEVGADVLIIDERAGCTEAKNRGLLVTGTLGALPATNFRIRRDIVQALLKRRQSQ